MVLPCNSAFSSKGPSIYLALSLESYVACPAGECVWWLTESQFLVLLFSAIIYRTLCYDRDGIGHFGNKFWLCYFLCDHFRHIILFFIFCLFRLFRATPAAYGGSQARDLIRAVAAGLRHSHARSKPRLQPTPQLMATPDVNPLSKARDRTLNLMVPSRVRFRCAMMGTPRHIILHFTTLILSFLLCQERSCWCITSHTYIW